ncbi:hypothetical protein BT67DRAFT_439952 [Trichocladium antarcticum]|uniref:Uncharacterized protein n=1 Tax=Trichocladium antarcticum TaxID=1450529 RepID=A0AAN6UQE4_9PEZI|nr:hypothetical protein BT67DRAFT_439952 [Trichocladium antarcticum]
MRRGASLSEQQPARDQKINSRWAALSMIGGVGSWFGGGLLHRVLAIAHPSQAVKWSSEGFLDECRSTEYTPSFPLHILQLQSPHVFCHVLCVKSFDPVRAMEGRDTTMCWRLRAKRSRPSKFSLCRWRVVTRSCWSMPSSRRRGLRRFCSRTQLRKATVEEDEVPEQKGMAGPDPAILP